MAKKVYKQKCFFFSAITKNLNWEILTKNLVTLEDEMGLKTHQQYLENDVSKSIVNVIKHVNFQIYRA